MGKEIVNSEKLGNGGGVKGKGVRGDPGGK